MNLEWNINGLKDQIAPHIPTSEPLLYKNYIWKIMYKKYLRIENIYFKI